LRYCENLILQGGGIRCLWQAGFLSVILPCWPRPPSRVLCVSASAAIGTTYAAGRLPDALRAFKAAVAGNPKNIYPMNIFKRTPVFPHAAIFSTTLRDLFDTQALKVLASGPRVEVLVSRPARHLSAARLIALMLGVGFAMRMSAGGIASRIRRVGGMVAEYIDAASCVDGNELAELVLASSCTPPFTPLSRFRGQWALDGELVQSPPCADLGGTSGPTLVLFTRCRPLPTHYPPNFVCAAPTRPIGGSAWDYTNAPLLDEFYEQGRADAEGFLACPARR